MRMFIYSLLLLISSTGAIAEQMENTVGGLTLAIKEVKSSGIVIVQISNSTPKPIRIWKGSNSWGAAHWRILLIRDGQLKTFFENPDPMFTRNVPGFDEIAAGGHIERTLDIVGDGWRGPDIKKTRFERSDSLIVIYDVPKQYVFPNDPDSLDVRKMGVWYGVVAAMTVVQ